MVQLVVTRLAQADGISSTDGDEAVVCDGLAVGFSGVSHLDRVVYGRLVID